MASVYILFSKTFNRFYIGSCNDLSLRLNEHLHKSFSDSFTAKATDWELFFSLENLGYKQARSIEVHLKKMKSVIYIKNLKKYPEIMEKLVNKYKLAE
jgi:putative endonuclease